MTIRDTDAYGCIVVQGHGSLGGHAVSSPTIIRYGQLTEDELFVSESAARDGVTITNPSRTEPLVLLKHFGPEQRGARRGRRRPRSAASRRLTRPPAALRVSRLIHNPSETGS